MGYSSRNLKRAAALSAALLLVVAIAMVSGTNTLVLGLSMTFVLVLWGTSTRAAPRSATDHNVRCFDDTALSFWPPGQNAMGANNTAMDGNHPPGGRNLKNHFVMSMRFCGARSRAGFLLGGKRHFGIQHYRARDQNGCERGFSWTRHRSDPKSMCLLATA